MKKKKWLYAALLAIVAIGMIGCGNDKKVTPKKTSGNKEEKALADEQVVSFAIPQEVASIDPAIGTDSASFGLINQVYEGFYRLDTKHKPLPAGAEKMATVSEDGLEYTLKLRADAVWSNGDPVIADDYIYAWRRVVSPETGAEYAYLFEPIKNAKEIIAGDKKPEELGIEAISDKEVKITLEIATPYFESLLAFPTFFPVQQKTVEKYGKDFATNDKTGVYNGPFILQDFDGVGSDMEWTYKKNEQYWDAKNVALTKVNATVVKESSTALNLFEDGQVDDVILSGELAQQSKSNDSFTTDKIGRTIYIDVNREKKEQHFNNLNLRKALSYAIDSEAIVNNVLGDGSNSLSGIIPENLTTNPKTGKDFTKDSGVHKTFDAKKAKDYWEKAKKELKVDTIAFDILTDDNDSTKKIAEYMQGAYKETLGIETTISVVTKPIRLDRTQKGDFDMVLTAWGADYNDQSTFLDLFVTGNPYNRGKYSNPKYDELIKEAATTNSTNPEKRWQNHLDAEKILLDEDAAVIPIYQVCQAHLRNPKMINFVPHTAGAPFDYKYIHLNK